MRPTIATVACALLALGGFGVAAAEITDAFGDGAVDEHVVREPIRKVLVDAEDGAVTLVRSTNNMHVRVRRSHVINTPSTSHQVADGVLTLKTRCPIGFVTCRSDYRLGVPAGVTVTIDKSSGRVDAVALGGKVTKIRDGAAPISILAQ